MRLPSEGSRSSRVASARSWLSGGGAWPWHPGSKTALAGWLRAHPFVSIYLGVTWSGSLLIPVPKTGEGSLLYFYIPNLGDDLPRALFSLLTAPWLNVGRVQLVYVTILLLTFGARMERDQGTVRTAAVFFVTTFLAAVGAGAGLHLLYPEIWDNSSLRFSWSRAWGGGSAGAFGILGALAASSRRPARMLALAAAWEAFVWAVNLLSYTVAFHYIALASGFLLARAVPIRPRAADSPGANPGDHS